MVSAILSLLEENSIRVNYSYDTGYISSLSPCSYVKTERFRKHVVPRCRSLAFTVNYRCRKKELPFRSEKVIIRKEQEVGLYLKVLMDNRVSIKLLNLSGLSEASINSLKDNRVYLLLNLGRVSVFSDYDRVLKAMEWVEKIL